MLSLLYDLTLRAIHDYWNDHRFDLTDLCVLVKMKASQSSEKASLKTSLLMFAI